MNETRVIPIEQLTEEPFASVLSFPKPSADELQSRLQELKTLGITAVEFSGKASLFGIGLQVLGKGFVGIVVKAYMGEKRVALKIRRKDADRANLLHEAQMLSIANSANVGPQLICASKNFLVMQVIEGQILPAWLKTKPKATDVLNVLVDVLEQCFRLDKAGLDHGELSKAPKHVLIEKDGKAFIVDFETSSIHRKVANVTAICQFLFLSNGSASILLNQELGEKDHPKLRLALRNYKMQKTRDNFEILVKICLGFKPKKPDGIFVRGDKVEQDESLSHNS